MNKEKNKKLEYAVFPASFNPIHNLHVKIIELAARTYSKLYVFVADNESKKYDVPLEKRYELVKKVISQKGLKNVYVHKQTNYETTPEFAKKNNIEFIVRGIRTRELQRDESDLAEKYLNINENLTFHYFNFGEENLSSTQIRNKIRNNENINNWVPEAVYEDIIKLWK